MMVTGHESWRESVLRGMLTAAAAVTPVLAALALFIRPSPRFTIDYVMIAGAGVALPVIRLAPRLSVRARASAAIAVLFIAGVFVLARAGFAAGVTVLLVSTCIIGVIYLGRGLGFLLIALSAAAHVVVGVLVTRGTLHLDASEVDPMLMQNWLRMTAVTGLLALMLAMVIDSVIRHVEASSRAATHALAELRLAYERLGKLHGRVEAAKEDERRFLAHELHDELGQTLTALKLRLQLGARAGNGGAGNLAGGSAGVVDAVALVDELIGRVRKMSVDLRPPLLDEVGLVPALRAYLDSQSALSGVAMDLEEDGRDAATTSSAVARLPSDLEIVCFRVAQESVTNVLRHASAQRLRVSIARSGSHVRLVVRDDGRGFDATSALDSAAAQGHLGVVGMRERVRARGGKFQIASRPGQGTAIEVDLPIAPARPITGSGGGP
jgi:signal transduction histidine kinase